MAREKSFEDDYRDFFKALNKYKVDYLIVGAYATMYHTKLPRTTNDIDIWIKPTEENIHRVIQAINEFSGLNVSKEDLMSEKDIFFIGIAPYRIDIFKSQGKIPFDAAWQKKEKGKFEKVDVYYLSKKHLLDLKRYFSREKDLQDIKCLKKKSKYSN